MDIFIDENKLLDFAKLSHSTCLQNSFEPRAPPPRMDRQWEIVIQSVVCERERERKKKGKIWFLIY